MPVDIDELSRKRIVEDLSHNLFVEASAGSGKTTSLVNRMVALIEKGDGGNGVPVDKICTITFTKAAADEFYARFQELLSRRSVNVPDKSDKDLGAKTTKSVERCQEALKNIDLCFLGTIDSFTNMVAHEMPNEIGIPSDAVVIGKEEREAMVKMQYNLILADDAHPLHKSALLFNSSVGKAGDAFAAGVELLLSKRNSVVEYDKSLLTADDNYFEPERTAFFNLAKKFCGLGIDFTANKSKITSADIERNKALKDIENKYQLLNGKSVIDNIEKFKYFFAPFNLIGAKKLTTPIDNTNLVNDGTLEPEGKTFKLTADSAKIIDDFKGKIDEFLYAHYFYLVSSAVHDVNKILKEEGKFDYDDFLYAVVEAFKKSCATNKELVKHIFDRHSYFLLDESQDTNPIQTRLFFYLTGEKTTDDWKKVEPKEGSLFIVGDPKQSIYGFRDADVNAFLETKALFAAKGELLILTKNFRSRVSIRDWLNLSMDDILNRGSAPLPHNNIIIPPEDRAMQIEGVVGQNETLLDGEYKYLTDPANEPIEVAKFIYDLVNSKKYKIISKNPAFNDDSDPSIKPLIYRTIEYKDFLIVPRSKDVSGFISAFSEYKIPMVIEAEIPFDNSPSLYALSNLVQLLKAPRDRHLVQEVLCGDIYKFDDGDILTILASGYDLNISNIKDLQLSEKKYVDAIVELNKLYIATKGMSFSSTLTYLLNNKDLTLLKRVSSDFLEYTYFLIEKVRQQEENGLLSGVGQFADYLNTFISGYTEENRVLRFKDKVNRVKIANLHKVKGLQAPIVMLVHPKETTKAIRTFVDNSVDPRILHVDSLSMKDDKFPITIVATHRYDDATRKKWQEHDDAEKDRLEYVGATRPESVLIVAYPTKLDSDEYNPWGNIINHIGDNKIISFPDIAVPNNSRDISNYIDPTIKDDLHKKSIEYRSPSTLAKDDKVEVKRDNEDVVIDKETITEATLMGSMVHKLMECLASSRDGFDRFELVDSVVEEYNGNQYRDLLLKVLDTIYHGGFQQKNSSVNKDILKTLLEAKDVMCEVPFSYRDGDTVTYGVIDLIYEDDSGYHIIDYKTNKDDDVARLEHHYKSQLDDYIKAVKQLGIDADAHIYHIDIK